jgi:hypothetical protein
MTKMISSSSSDGQGAQTSDIGPHGSLCGERRRYGDKVKPLPARGRHYGQHSSASSKPFKEAEVTPGGYCGAVRPASHFNCRMTVPSEMVGAAAPVLPAFLLIQSRATRMLSSVPALSW